MAEYQEVIKQYKRMCEIYKDTCDGCPLEKPRGLNTCWRWCFEEPEKAEELVMNWAKEHQPVTNADKFKEVFGYRPFRIMLFNDDFIKWLHEEYKEPEDGRSNEN